MPLYRFIITLIDDGLPYPDAKSAQEDCDEWANEIASSESCHVEETKVEEVTE